VPIYYDCQRCTACCRWPGQVRLEKIEITRIAAFMEMNEFDWIQEYTRLRADRRGLALKDKPNGECVFLHGNDCHIQSVKPQQCRDFPNKWRFPGFEEICHAIPREVTQSEYEQLIDRNQCLSPMSPHRDSSA
jgi:Fe-S-cluster containining protein